MQKTILKNLSSLYHFSVDFSTVSEGAQKLGIVKKIPSDKMDVTGDVPQGHPSYTAQHHRGAKACENVALPARAQDEQHTGNDSQQ